jgi:hypothetical protein
MAFDVTPAETSSSPYSKGDPPNPYYAFSLHCNHSITDLQNNWLLWDSDTNSIKLTDHVQPSCFVDINRPNNNCGSFRLVIKDPHEGTRRMLEIRTSGIQAEDPDLAMPLTTSYISFVAANEDPEDSVKVLFAR